MKKKTIKYYKLKFPRILSAREREREREIFFFKVQNQLVVDKEN